MISLNGEERLVRRRAAKAGPLLLTTLSSHHLMVNFNLVMPYLGKEVTGT